MRLWIIIALAAVTLGCRTTDSSSRREIALLRTEILDLEDQYYLLKSRCSADGMSGVDDYYSEGTVVQRGGYAEGYPEQYYPAGTINSGCSCANCAECGRLVYDASDQHLGQQILSHQPVGSEVYYPEATHSVANPQPIANPLPIGNSQPIGNSPLMITEGEEIQGNEIVDPMGQPFDETSSEPVLPDSGHITPRNFRQRSNERVQEPRTATHRFKPDPRFSQSSDYDYPSLENESGQRSSDGWVQNSRPPRNNVGFEHQAGLGNDKWGPNLRPQEFRQHDPERFARGQYDRGQQSAIQWQQASTQRREDSYSISSEPLDDHYLPSEELDGFSELSERLNNERTDSRLARQVFIDPEHTYGRDFDNDGEQDGISLLVQPLDEQGNVLSMAADLVISLIDPAEIGEKQRIGLWKYESYQVESFVSNQRGRRGLALELPWQRRAPRNRRLLVFVRYTTQSGERLETSLDVRIDPPENGYEPELDDSIVNRNYREFRSVPTTAGNPTEVPKWRPVR